METIKCGKRYALRCKDDGKYLQEFGYADSLVDASLVDEFYAKHVAGLDENIEIVTVEETLHILSDNVEQWRAKGVATCAWFGLIF